MANHDGSVVDADIDVARLFGAIWRRKFFILVGAAIITAVVFFLLQMISPKYKSDARVLIETNESVFTRPTQQENTPQEPQVDVESVASQVQIITSSNLLMAVANQLNLAASPEFNDTLSTSALKRGLIALGLAEDPSVETIEKQVLQNLRKRLDVYAVDDSRVLVIAFESTDEELAAKLPNALAEAYVALESQEQLATTGRAAEYLSTEIRQLQDSVQLAEARVEEFRSANDLFAATDQISLTNQELSELSGELSTVRAERSSVEARVRTIESALQSGGALDTVPDVVNSPLITRLIERQVALRAQLADLATTLLPQHPRIKALQSQIAGLDQQVAAQARNVMQSLRNQADIARSREEELSRDLNQLKAAASQANESSVELRALEREAASQRALLESYLIRFREARSRDEVGYVPAKARLISRATVPFEADFPKVLPMTAASFIGSLILMMLIVLMSELFSGRALVPAASATRRQSQTVPLMEGSDNEHDQLDDADAHLDDRPIPVHAAATAHAKGAAGAPSNDNYSVDKLADNTVAEGLTRLLVVSPEGDAGSANAVATVRNLSDRGLRAVLLDLTGTGASTERMLSNPMVAGITDLLASKASYSSVIHSDARTHAHIIPMGMTDAQIAAPSLDRLPIILNALQSAYDVLIIDCGNTNYEGLARLINADSQIVLSIVKGSGTQFQAAAQSFAEHGAQDLMFVVADQSFDPDPGHPNLMRTG